jgi:hypothetical protein
MSFQGEFLTPDHLDYDSQRTVFNAMFDRRPAVIARCVNAWDVAYAIHYARDRNWSVAVRGGGHSIAGNSTCDGGALIDLSLMKKVQVDSTCRIARAEPGLRLGEFDRATQTFGLATPLGIASDTGIAGLTLGGGIGWLNGKYGLACDNLLSVEIVTADGYHLTANSSTNQDLFWAVRGGGGNFGIVTSLEYQLHSVGPVLGGMVLYNASQGDEVLPFYIGFSQACPDELTTACALLTTPEGTLAIAIVVCYCGNPAEGEKILKAFGEYRFQPTANLIRPIPYVEMQSLLDGAFLPGRRHYWKASFIRRLTSDAIQTVVQYASIKPSPLTTVVLQQIHGAACRVGLSETAFAHRQPQFDFAIMSQWEDPDDTEKNIQWTREFWQAMQPFVEKDVYVNNLANEGDARVRAAYGINYARLVEIKNKFDPTNFFRLNQNIQPHS